MIFTIVGGTGTLGTEFIKQLGIGHEIRCVSRCELKQQELRAKYPHVQMYLGDIRDAKSLRKPFKNADVVFHVAALKHVDVMEANPEECVKTNILGTINVCDVAEEMKVKRVIFSSTDKAVSPINVYGMAKGISEKIMLDRGHLVYRWANVLFSRGAATHYFARNIRLNQPVNLTHPDMSRFWIRIEDAVQFVLATYKDGSGVMIPAMKAAPVMDLIHAIGLVVGNVPNIRVTELRPGEKIHESIMEGVSSNNSPQYTIKELVDILKPVIEVT